ncbi:hypothetical protein T492DRAFT_1131388 [Pavlovales sp. CCMP2436]|nr:hypothetical protein T492DRAFT_1131388 [Pavlovales sp. CCMP2436]
MAAHFRPTRVRSLARLGKVSRDRLGVTGPFLVRGWVQLGARGLAVTHSPFPSIEPHAGSVADLVMTRWAAFSSEGRVAVVDETGSRTFAELHTDVLRIAGALRARGLQRGDVVAVVSPNHLDYGTLALAVLRLGAVLSPANPAYTPAELKTQLRDSHARIVVAHPSTVDAVRGATHDLPAVHTLACMGGAAELPPGMFPLDAWRSNVELFTCSAEGVDASTLAVLPFSSGTTGLPKGTMLTHGNLSANLLQFVAPEGRHIACRAPVICPLPAYHIYAFTTALLFPLWRGHSLVTMSRFDLRTFCEQVPRLSFFAPELAESRFELVCYHELLHIRSRTTTDWYNFRMTCPMTARLETTIFSARSLNRLPGAQPNAGKGVLAELVDVAAGSEGELLVSGPQVMVGYLNLPEATARTLVTCKEGITWLRTGDVAKVDEAGFVFITDRAKELIKYKGFQVAPAELEAVILTHPLVTDCAVIGVADLEAGEVPRAYVVLKDYVLKDGAPPVETLALADWVGGRVAPHKRLRGGVVLCEGIPKSASGKILRRLVREQDRAEAQRLLENK